jgi:hypothetical protein
MRLPSFGAVFFIKYNETGLERVHGKDNETVLKAKDNETTLAPFALPNFPPYIMW